MAKYLNCIECGRQVSDQARQCPNCKYNPHGVKCEICQIPAKWSDVYCAPSGFHHYYRDSLAEYIAHKECADEVFAEIESLRLPCPTCKSNIRALDDCPHCGHSQPDSNPGNLCVICHMRVIKEGAVHIRDKYTYAHRSCARRRKGGRSWFQWLFG